MSDEITETLSTRLVALCDMGGVKPAELRKLAGLKSTQHAMQILAGERRDVTALTAVKVARAFGVSTDWLVTGEGKAPDDAAVKRAVKRGRIALAIAAVEERESCE